MSARATSARSSPLNRVPAGASVAVEPARPGRASWRAARTARRGRGSLVLHLPGCWHRQVEWHNLFQAACGPPRARAA